MAVLVTAGLLLSLAACSTPTDSASGCDATPSGSVSDSIKVAGDFGSEPKTTFDIPLTVPETTQRTVVTKGDGDTVLAGDNVNVKFSIYSGANSADIAGSDWSSETTERFPVDDAQFLPGLVKTLECSTVGSRVVGVIPPVDAFGETGSPDLGIGASDAIVFVVDVVSIEQPLKPAEWTKDIPEVTFADDGTPTVTLPATDPPKDLVETVLTEGDGAVVEATSTVTIDYQGTSWTTGEMFDQSYGKQPDTRAANAYVPGFTAALVGQKAGSTVLVSIPPEDAYGLDPDAHPLGGQTLVFLIVIKAVS
jgi:peptidylprolyl isomerase